MRRCRIFGKERQQVSSGKAFWEVATAVKLKIEKVQEQ
jgi:hypothetical protein